MIQSKQQINLDYFLSIFYSESVYKNAPQPSFSIFEESNEVTLNHSSSKNIIPNQYLSVRRDDRKIYTSRDNEATRVNRGIKFSTNNTRK
jgi:hypothetical protein